MGHELVLVSHSINFVPDKPLKIGKKRSSYPVSIIMPQQFTCIPGYFLRIGHIYPVQYSFIKTRQITKRFLYHRFIEWIGIFENKPGVKDVSTRFPLNEGEQFF